MYVEEKMSTKDLLYGFPSAALFYQKSKKMIGTEGQCIWVGGGECIHFTNSAAIRV